ncbi:hypothetical protein NB311A_01579 [Nitrobacter sp. Nb-311A]|uniref:hypothetical protein n=1 Tax=unclassified Nitrobacter TaxID=2620411 RepID=UPI0000687F9A|nr:MULTISPECIES: hypothetical protein [unclassified Nitrobacter]EAQ36154.1 hypothetical protein NB311A_01579 [Nitrobacter sp. Nb-311A]MCB1391636.1 hypothetical protein [Nitrobacter sp.]MCV0386932.1 hypothetical protein [Nitrobacter sp.]
MTLDKILKEHAASIQKRMTSKVFPKVGDGDLTFPQEMRDRRAAELQASIDALSIRREETIARFDQEIAALKKELEALKTIAIPAVAAVAKTVKKRQKK